MAETDLTWIANYIWGIADDVLRDLCVRGKYRDVILPMTVLRRHAGAGWGDLGAQAQGRPYHFIRQRIVSALAG